MGLFSKNKNQESAQEKAQARIEGFMSFVSIYNQALLASHLGITDIKAFPDLMLYKQTMHIPTTGGGRLGTAERAHVKKIMIADYNVPESFFKEIDASVRKNCRATKDIQKYFVQFGNFTNDILTHLYTEYQWKIQGSLLFKKMLRSVVRSSIEKSLNTTSWKSFETATTVKKIKATSASLGYSTEWMTEFAYQVLALARKKR